MKYSAYKYLIYCDCLILLFCRNTTELTEDTADNVTLEEDETDEVHEEESSKFSSPRSGLLMPPPSIVPSKKTVPKLSNVVGEVSNDLKNNTVMLTDKEDIFASLNEPVALKSKHVTVKGHCSVPANTLKCFTNNSVPVDCVTKKKLRKQMAEKINHAKKKWDMDIDEKDMKTCGVRPLKKDEDHFKNKKLVIEHVDVFNMGLPMRSSTPTPSIGGTTVLAGQFDEENSDPECDASTSGEGSEECNGDEQLDTGFEIRRRSADKEEGQDSKLKTPSEMQNSFCRKWIEDNDKVHDPPPSVVSYTTNNNVSNSSLDITSVSHVPKKQNVPVKKSGGITPLREKFSNTMFV